MSRLCVPLGLACALASCATPSRDRGWVSDELVRRVGHGLRARDADARAIDPGVAIDEDEVVALALMGSEVFATDLARLRSATADFDEAARIDNPRISLQAPIGSIVAAVGLLAPLISIFQLPQRTEAAGRALESVAESLVQSGLDLVRDARLAHLDLVLAERRLAILRELAVTAGDLNGIADARAAAGDVSPADALIVQADASIAADQVAIAERDARAAGARLQLLLGREAGEAPRVELARPRPGSAPDLQDLLRVARDSRPDVRAAELELEGAMARAGWERSRIVTLSGQVDAQWNNTVAGVRVGGAIDVPIFNQNQGGVGRAEAAIEAAEHRAAANRQRVTMEVVTAHAQLTQAIGSAQRYEREILPPLTAALDAATLRYELGDDSYLVVLDALRRLGGARIRAAELDADVRRAHAELERATGARLELARTAPRAEASP
ncbi:MAG: TolC family protein [Sandaracinaceae bacterium]